MNKEELIEEKKQEIELRFDSSKDSFAKKNRDIQVQILREDGYKVDCRHEISIRGFDIYTLYARLRNQGSLSEIAIKPFKIVKCEFCNAIISICQCQRSKPMEKEI